VPPRSTGFGRGCHRGGDGVKLKSRAASSSPLPMLGGPQHRGHDPARTVSKKTLSLSLKEPPRESRANFEVCTTTS